jgi:hypothetical protein
MKKTIVKFLSGAMGLMVAACASAMTIVPTFDSSITSDSNAAIMEADINAAIAAFESNYTDAVTVNIMFVSDPTVGLGQSSTFGTAVSYQQYLAALKGRATSLNDSNAISQLPNSANDPVIGGSQINLNLALARLLGLVPSNFYGAGNLDSTISFNMTLMNFTRPPTNINNYDLVSVAEHEMDEVLGTSSALPSTNMINPADLFRYTTNLARSFTNAGPDNAYFSADGTNLFARYNTESDGDFGDWWSDTNYWAPHGITPHPQVQDAFGTPGSAEDMATNEMTLLDVVGFTLAVPAPPVSPTLSIARLGAGQANVSWTPTTSGFTLQERANLLSGSWAASATGTNNPATITISSGPKFYRLAYKATPAAVAAVDSVAQRLDTPPLLLNLHVLHPRRR